MFTAASVMIAKKERQANVRDMMKGQHTEHSHHNQLFFCYQGQHILPNNRAYMCGYCVNITESELTYHGITR